MFIPHVNTADAFPTSDPRCYVGDGHYTAENDDRAAIAIRDKIQQCE